MSVTSLPSAVNRYAEQPLYRQVSDLIEERLVRGAAPGDKLPGEVELARNLGVHRLTVRRALTELQQRGLIETVHGKGSFVAAPVVRYDISGGRDASFTRSMRDLGHNVRVQLLATHGDAHCPSTALGTVLCVDTLRLVDDQPWSVSRTWIPAHLSAAGPDEWTGETSLYEFLADRHGLRMLRSNRTFAAVLAQPEEAPLLLVQVGAPLLEMRGLNVDQHGAPVSYVQHRFRGDRIEFTVELE